jgi:hypothetical protein
MNDPQRYTIEQLAEDVEEMLEMLYENTGLRPGLDYDIVTVYVDGNPLEFEVGNTEEGFQDGEICVEIPPNIIASIKAHQIE